MFMKSGAGTYALSAGVGPRAASAVLGEVGGVYSYTSSWQAKRRYLVGGCCSWFSMVDVFGEKMVVVYAGEHLRSLRAGFYGAARLDEALVCAHKDSVSQPLALLRLLVQ